MFADEFDLQAQGIIAMAGHEDGIISYATTANAAGEAMIDILAKAKNLDH